MGIPHNTIGSVSSDADIRLISSSENWMEGAALQQLHKTAELEGMRAVAGMPDLHPGRGYPIGAAFFSVGRLYPALVGNDIGCGMSLWQSSIKVRRLHLDKLVKRLKHVEGALDQYWAPQIDAGKIERNIRQRQFDQALGTIGGGNHFAEFQAVDDVFMPELFDQQGLDQSKLLLLVHSGSRGLGQKILTEHIQQHNHQGLKTGSPECQQYIADHDEAVRWAELNRELIAWRFLEAVRSDGECLLDINHNTVLPAVINGPAGWLHRQGATPADEGMVVIPGSRGDYSYLVQPVSEKIPDSLFSLAHGAGRKWKRSEVKERLKHRFKQQDLIKTSLGSRVICGDKELMYEEVPQAYKNCDQVVACLVDAGLVHIVARLRPVVTFKTQGRCQS